MAFADTLPTTSTTSTMSTMSPAGPASELTAPASELTGPAWRSATGALVGNFVSATPMVNAVFGIFLVPVATEFGWRRASVSLVLAIVAAVGVLAYPLVGRLADRHGARPIVLAGNVLFAASLAALALANGSLAQWYGLFVLVGVAAALPSTVVLTKVVTGWFSARRGLMLGLTAGVGNGAGATVMPIVAGLLLAHHGWRGAYVGLGCVTLLLGWPAMFLLLREAPVRRGSGVSATATATATTTTTTTTTAPPQLAASDVGSTAVAAADGVPLAAAVRQPRFWMVLLAVALGAGSMTAVFTHVVPMLMDRGVALGEATSVLVVFALVCVAWQVAIGVLLDRSPSPRIAIPFYLAALAGLLLFERAGGPATRLLAGALMGIGLGTEYGLLPYVVSRYFGLRAYGAIYGLVYGAVVLTMGTTPFLIDLVFDATGRYTAAFVAIDVALVAGTLLLWRLPAYGMARQATAPLVAVRRPAHS